jgi:hypothetical protein
MGKKQLAHEIKLGKIQAVIWANETEDRKLWFSVTVSRFYQSDNAWKETPTFRRDDLPIAVKALDMAYSWIWRKELKMQRAEQNAANTVLANAGR